MTPLDLIAEIRQAGGSVTVESGSLRIAAPPGTITEAHRQVLRDHKAILLRLLDPTVEVDPYLDQERQAIVWSETGPAEELDQALDQAQREWSRLVGAEQEPIVIRGEFVGDELRLHCPTPEILAKIEAGREIIQAVLDEPVEQDDPDAGPDPWDSAVEPVPCGSCGGLLAWWDATGGIHCQACEPASKSERVLIHGADIRKRNYRRANVQPDPVPIRFPLIGCGFPPFVLKERDLRCDRCGSTDLLQTVCGQGRWVDHSCKRCGKWQKYMVGDETKWFFIPATVTIRVRETS